LIDAHSEMPARLYLGECAVGRCSAEAAGVPALPWLLRAAAQNQHQDEQKR
jgi:hypothetical protein